MDFERKRRHVKELNLIALIDIVFHLMVFVMLTTSFVVSESLELSLPSGKTNTSSFTAHMGMLRLKLNSDDTVTNDGRILSLTQMGEMLTRRMGKEPDIRIAVISAPGVSVQQLVTVLDAVYRAGGRNIQVDKVE